MIRFYYHETDDEGGGGLVEFTDRVNLDNRNVSVTTNAEQMSVGSSSIVVDDPDGDWATSGHRKVLIIEDAAPAENQVLFWGYTAERTIERQGPPVLAVRKWTVNLTDINTLIGRRVMAGNDTDRPEETDVERVQWLLGTSEANAFDDVTTYVSTAGPVDMSDSDYNGQALQSILDDCCQQSGKNAYMRWVWDTSDYVAALWYGDDSVNAAQSTLRITNLVGFIGVDNTWGASDDSSWKSDPSRVFSGVFGNYDGGWVYENDTDTSDAFARRDTISSWPNVRKGARATARALRYLNTLDTEEAIISTSIMVPPENVNDAHAGDLIRVRFSHFPGFQDEFVPVRILNRTVTFVTPEWYQIDYQLVRPTGAISNVGETIGGYLCTEDGFQVPTDPGPALDPMVSNDCTNSYSDSPAGNNSQPDNYGRAFLYAGATYAYNYHVDHGPTNCLVSIRMVGMPAGIIIANEPMGSACPCGPGLAVPHRTDASGQFTVGGTIGVDDHYWQMRCQHTSYSGCSVADVYATAVLTYVSGPDPRFEDLEGCPFP